PLDNRGLAAYSPDRKFFFAREDTLLRYYMRAVKVAARPATLDAYLSQVVTPALEALKREGAVAFKYEAAYLRRLDFTRGDMSAAGAAYNRDAANGSIPTAAEYTAIQDVIFHHIAVEEGRPGIPIQHP